MPAVFPCLVAASLLMAGPARDVPADEGGYVRERDPHRPPCTSAKCRTLKAYLKAHYCGEAPFGNGPDDGCQIRPLETFGPRLSVKADWRCEWVENEGKSKCQQTGEPAREIRSLAMAELRRVGLPAKPAGPVYFSVWESPSSGWSLVQAFYFHIVGTELATCQVILLVDSSSNVIVLRKVRFHKTSADVPEGTSWTPVDLVDIDGDGQLEVVLEGDAYEDHWLEVVRVKDGSVRTVFSGLGYYL